MTEQQQSLWLKIQQFELDDANSTFTFTDRLARENDWGFEYSLRVIQEYKRFMFLICIGNHSLTPSDQVDQVWHLHLIYTQLYWTDFCKNTIQQEIHHGPTKGGNEEKVKYEDLYEKTKSLYKKVFDKEPPTDIWPSSKIRFGELKFTRINRHRNWVVPKIRFKLW